MKHAEGPWTYRKKSQCVDGPQTNSDENVGYGAYQICVRPELQDFTEQTIEANLKLCAAAPELLLAAKRALEELTTVGLVVGVKYPVLKELIKAIAKAEGK